MMIIIGIVASLFSLVGLIFSIKHGLNDNYEKSHKGEICCVLWLIAALICFK